MVAIGQSAVVEDVDEDLTAMRLAVPVTRRFVESDGVDSPPGCEFGWVRHWQPFVRIVGKVILVVSPFLRFRVYGGLWSGWRRDCGYQLFLLQAEARDASD